MKKVAGQVRQLEHWRLVVALPGNEIQVSTGQELKSWQTASLDAVAGTAMYWLDSHTVTLAHTVSVTVVAANLTYCPVPQVEAGVHEAALPLFGLKVLAGQGEQSTLEEVVGAVEANEPAGHCATGAQVDRPAVDAKVSGGQAVQAVAGDWSASAVPAGQANAAHEPVDRAGTKLPGPHATQGVEGAESTSEVPTGQDAQDRSVTVVAGTTICSPATHTVRFAQTVLVVAVAAVLIYWYVKSQSETVEQTRFEVAVGGVDWYSFDVHTVRLPQTLSAKSVAGVMRYCVAEEQAVTGEHTRLATGVTSWVWKVEPSTQGSASTQAEAPALG
jgi:hypothetical protein